MRKSRTLRLNIKAKDKNKKRKLKVTSKRLMSLKKVRGTKKVPIITQPTS